MVTFALVTRPPQCKRHEGRCHVRQAQRDKSNKSGPGGPFRLLGVEYFIKGNTIEDQYEKAKAGSITEEQIGFPMTQPVTGSQFPKMEGKVHKFII